MERCLRIVAWTCALLLLPAIAAGSACAAQATTAKYGEPKKLVFTVSKRDQRAITAKKQGDAVAKRAKAIRDQVALDQSRVDKIEALIADAEAEADRLGDELQNRAIERYMHGGDEGDLAFVLTASSVSDALDRAGLIDQVNQGDERLALERAITLEQLEQLRTAAEELRDAHAEQAAVLEERATSLADTLVSARQSHVTQDASLPVEGDAGVDGTWFVQAGKLPWALISTSLGSYNGGTRTPARQATPAQIASILNNPAIDIYAGGREDIAVGRIDGRLIDALQVLAQQFGSIRITSMISGHGVFTTSGNVSEHSFGCAADIGSVSGIRIEPSTQGPGTITEQAVRFLSGLGGDLAPHQVISLNSYGGPSLAMADHYDHIHLGYHC
jgi:hypothetical protein